MFDGTATLILRKGIQSSSQRQRGLIKGGHRRQAEVRRGGVPEDQDEDILISDLVQQKDSYRSPSQPTMIVKTHPE